MVPTDMSQLRLVCATGIHQVLSEFYCLWMKATEQKMHLDNPQRLLADPAALARHVADALLEPTFNAHQDVMQFQDSWSSSAVLFLLRDPPVCNPQAGPRLVLNKRSALVPQPGDLCCPGGGISHRWDRPLSWVVDAPGLPLSRWPLRYQLARSDANRRDIALLVATALREGFEEMRLFPHRVTFLGLLPPQRLRLLRRVIHPVVARLQGLASFRPNWEVDAVVSIPLRHLLDPNRYARIRVRFEHDAMANERIRDDFTCFQHVSNGRTEVLWGATFRIASVFLQRVFSFCPPPADSLPLIHATLDETYLTGSNSPRRKAHEH